MGWPANRCGEPVRHELHLLSAIIQTHADPIPVTLIDGPACLSALVGLSARHLPPWPLHLPQLLARAFTSWRDGQHIHVRQQRRRGRCCRH